MNTTINYELARTLIDDLHRQARARAPGPRRRAADRAADRTGTGSR